MLPQFDATLKVSFLTKDVSDSAKRIDAEESEIVVSILYRFEHVHYYYEFVNNIVKHK